MLCTYEFNFDETIIMAMPMQDNCFNTSTALLIAYRKQWHYIGYNWERMIFETILVDNLALFNLFSTPCVITFEVMSWIEQLIKLGR